MRTPITHWNTEPLSRTNNNICPKFTRWLQHCQCQKITCHYNLNPISMSILNELPIIQNFTLSARILDKNTTNIARFVINVLKISSNNFQIETISSGLANINSLRVTVIGNDKSLLLSLLNVITHGHCLRSRGSFIEQRSIRHGQASKIRYKGLEVKQRLKTPLGYLSLVRGVLGIPSRVFHYVPQNYRWDMSVIVPHPNIGLENLVLRSQTLHMINHLALC
ncbi:hypothetical protein PanWU01x14_181830 [Parasponia andersonii]|uniref:Uncharacterized protein n=1 Tax=Parasponia andersonii TaxID=3476 RepID=A0A2P5C5J3_PARAD|nr:hypothetical protein PanWU01x14_181830 [Parasponia andersonii]